MNRSFEIVCNGSDSSRKAFLPSIDMEVLEINMSDPYNIIVIILIIIILFIMSPDWFESTCQLFLLRIVMVQEMVVV
jgi:hypothetical protein